MTLGGPHGTGYRAGESRVRLTCNVYLVWISRSLIVLFLPSLCPPSPGAAFTRFQTLRLQRIFPEVLAEQLISYGSCQFPTLGFVVERFKAIQAFVPEIFHKIKGKLGSCLQHGPLGTTWL